MKKEQPIPDDISETRGIHAFGDWCPSVTVGGKQINAEVKWLSKLARDATLQEALELYPANPHLEHAEGGGAWSMPCLDMTVGTYLMDGADRVMRVTLNLRNLDIKSVDDIVGLGTIPRIDELLLGGNYLGDDDIKALARMPFADTVQILDLSNNVEITVFPTSAFPILEVLYLGSTNISDISVVEPSLSLEWLELNHTKISIVDAAGLSRFPNLIRFDIADNVIREIPNIASLEDLWKKKGQGLE
nr:hypothetical protein [Candidatus Sigynarchaeum springense]